MTQVKEWSNQELNRALTELQGYSVKPERINPKWYRMVNPQGQEFGVALPSEEMVWKEYAFPYCTDPAASLEVQTAAITSDNNGYVRNLSIVKWRAAVDPEEVEDWTSIGIQSVGELLTASPRERAEAAYITLSSKQ